MLQSIDTAVFRFINQSLAQPFLDPFITLFNGGTWFKRLAVLAGILVFWKGNACARLCLLFIAASIIIGDGLIVGSVKRIVGRQRPYQQFTDTRHITGNGDAGSMPSGHAANSAAAAFVISIFYRRARFIAIPVAALVSFARVYSGVHFPSDVLTGAALACLYTPAILYGSERLWRKYGPSIAPDLSRRIPSLLHPTETPPAPPTVSKPIAWLNLGWCLIAFTLLLRLLYLASGKIELSEDEAYQWQWSKHLALSYYSKPPLIAYVQFLGTSIFGDTQFGIRFLSPIFAALSASAIFLLIARNFNPRAAFFTVAALCCTPMPAVGATLMTIDALSVLFWTLAMLNAWRAAKTSCLTSWSLTGLCIAFGLLAKYIALAQWLSIFLFLALGARDQFRKPGLYIAIIISLLGLLPVIIWNQQNDWITLTHLSERSGLDQAWKFTGRYFNDFIWSELGLLNPVFAILATWATLKFWKNRTPFQTFLFCMGAPLFIGYLLYTFRARVQPNWIAPAILPLFALGATFWEPRWPENRRWLQPTLKFGFALGFIAVIFLHDTNLSEKIISYQLPAKLDPLRRVRAWSPLVALVEDERKKLENSGGRQTFIIGAHYGVTSLMRFYNPDSLRIFALATEKPHNQYFFWDFYLGRAGQNAIFVQRADAPSEIPPELRKQFESIEDLGVRKIEYRGQVFHTVQLYACKNLLKQPSRL